METQTTNRKLTSKELRNQLKGATLPYQVLELKEFNDIPRYTKELFIVLDFGMIAKKNGEPTHLQAVRLRRNDYTIYTDNVNQGGYQKPDTLRTIFDSKTKTQIIETILDFETLQVNKENLSCYVPKLKYDNPELYRQQQALQKYFEETIAPKFEKQWVKMNTEMAYYQAIETDEPGIIKHLKFRISNIMATATNFDISEIITDDKDNIIKPEAYVKTVKVKNDDMARWLYFDNGFEPEDLDNMTHEAFKN